MIDGIPAPGPSILFLPKGQIDPYWLTIVVWVFFGVVNGLTEK